MTHKKLEMQFLKAGYKTTGNFGYYSEINCNYVYCHQGIDKFSIAVKEYDDKEISIEEFKALLCQ